MWRNRLTVPARKPQGLHSRHSTKPEIEKRNAQEEALQPARALPKEPARLEGHPVAAKTWRRLLQEFDGLKAVVVTRLDIDLLLDYCLLTEQVEELDELRTSAREVWRGAYEAFLAAKKELSPLEVSKYADKVQGGFDQILKLDGRADRKRALLLQIRQTMYLTPRSRAGAAPEKKDPPEEPDALETLLKEAQEIVKNGAEK